MMLAFKVIVSVPDNGELGGNLHAALGGGGPGGKTRNFGDAEAALIRRAAAQQLLESAACFVCIWWAGRKLTLTPVCCPSLWPLVPQGCAVDAGHARLVPVEVPPCDGSVTFRKHRVREGAPKLHFRGVWGGGGGGGGR